MRKLSFLIALCTLLTVGGVYATWTYTQNTDVADESVAMALNLTDVAYSGSYGTYKINKDTLTLKVDPKPGTSHITSLIVEGEIVVTFTPNSAAPQEVKDDGVPTTFTFSLSNDNWVYNDGEGAGERPIVVLAHTGAEDIVWGEPDENGVFTFVITAADIMEHIQLGDFLLDTKADYDAFTNALRQGLIVFTVSDGITVTP